MKSDDATVDAIAIGRNEGARLRACLAALAQTPVRRVIYVDSGSTDGSAEMARAAGAEVVALDMSQPFTAARARNAGFARMMALPDPPRFVQFLDGDCAIQPGWIEVARDFLISRPAAVVACGRRRERFPGASVYNRLADAEWDTPTGPALACGGDALMKVAAVAAAGGYRETLIAGEEPEFCLRLRRAGGEIWRLDHEMTLHDAAMTRFSQWWKRTRRAGHAFAEGAALHGAPPDRHWVRETRRALIWGAGLPMAVVIAGLIHPAGFALALAWPAQVARLTLRGGADRAAFEESLFTVLGKFPEALGALGYYRDRLRGRSRGLIEYK